MKTAYLGALAFSALALGACSSDEPNDPDIPFDNPDWVLSDDITLSSVDTRNIAALSDFNDKLLSGVAQNSLDGSFCVSPLSVSIYLGMIANSSQGEVQQQIINALNCSNLDEFNSLSTRLLQYLPSSKNGAVTHIANHVWVADRYSVPESYVSTMADIFNAGVDHVDFSKDRTFININNWASDNTEGLIKTLFEKNMWPGLRNTPLVCANAVYFKGSWDKEFDKKETKNETFHAPGGDITTPMMHKSSSFSYAASDNAQMVSLDYKNKNTVCEIYLPAEGTDVRDITKIINENERAALRASVNNRYIELSMPSFEMAGSMIIDDVLKNLGITDMDHTDLSPMGINEKRKIDTMHKVVVKVDEEGTEMAGVTYGTEMLIDSGNFKMVVNRPFMFVIRNKATQTVLMAGVVTNPKN